MKTKLHVLIGMSLFLSIMPIGAQKKIEMPLMGWSSWNTYHVNINEKLIKEQAGALIKQGLKEVGYTYINIDDGFTLSSSKQES